MKCQATYLIKVLKGFGQLTEDQAYRGGQFLGFNSTELEHFLDLVRYDRAVDQGLKKHFEKAIEARIASLAELKNRVRSGSLEASVETQLKYFTSWKPSALHLATSCPHLQTEIALVERFQLEPARVREILEFLVESELVTYDGKKYCHSGKSIHLPKDSPLHKTFQRQRREMVLRSLDRAASEDLHFSSAFATSRTHMKAVKDALLKLIEGTHEDLAHTESEEVVVFSVDLFRAV